MAKKRSRKRRQERRRIATGAPGQAAGEDVAQGAESPAAAGPKERRPEPARRRGPGDPPEAPWGSFPLSEIVVGIAIVLLVGGFFVAPPRGAVMLGAGLVLGSLAGLELSAREHFAGYRSHTVLLAGAAGVAVLAGTLALSDLDPAICGAAGLVVFGLCAWLLAMSFRRRSGGALFRFKGG